jgi:chemotaxis protein histidine kinase CheA
MPQRSVTGETLARSGRPIQPQGEALGMMEVGFSPGPGECIPLHVQVSAPVLRFIGGARAGWQKDEQSMGADEAPSQGSDLSQDPVLLEAFFEEATESLQALERALLLLENGTPDGGAVNGAFRAAHTIKGNAGSIGLDAIMQLAHAIEGALGHVRDGSLAPERHVVDALLGGADALAVMLAAGTRGEPAPGKGDAAIAALRALVSGGPQAIAAPIGLTQPLESLAPPEAPAGGRESSTIRVATERVDKLVNLAGELVVTQSVVAQLVATLTPERLPLLREAVAELERHSREIQERVMSIRMLPLGHLFARLPRLVRDLAARTGKEVELVVSGEDTEVDKSVIEKIADPLVHLIRNAVDHGIESAEERARAGKGMRGTLTVRAGQSGGLIFIEVADDGAGLDRDRILCKAIAVGLVTAADDLDDEAVHTLILAPGLSTASAVTDVSGRGVGMDVVKQNVEALGGTISIASERGRGVRIRIELPLTLAILDGQLVRVGDQTYVVPLVNVVESRRPVTAELGTVLGQGDVLRLRDEVLPIIRLHRLLGVEPASQDLLDGILIVVEGARGRIALLIDGQLGQHQVVVKSLEPNFQRVGGIAGATILGDGRVSLILDVSGLVAMTQCETTRGPSHALNDDERNTRTNPSQEVSTC